MFSSCNVSKLFILSNRSCKFNDTDFQAPAKWQGEGTECNLYIYYETMISRSENAHMLANLQIPSSLSESIIPDSTAVFVVGDVFV